MDLKTWLISEPGRTARLQVYLTEVIKTISADKEVAYAQIWGWTRDEGDARKRPIPAPMARAIETFTTKFSKPGEDPVMRWDSCPNDWFVLWPELRRRKGAPDYPGKPTVDADADEVSS